VTFGDLLRDTLSTLWTHKVRTGLTMFGIAWGIVSIMLMVAAGEGLRVGQAKVAETLGKDIMIVFAGRTSLQAGGLRAGRRITWIASDHQAIQAQTPSCSNVLPELGQGSLPVRSSYNSAALLVTGSLPPFGEIRSIWIGKGRFYGWNDEREARRVAVLGSDARKQLFASREAIGETIQLGEHPYTVIGVMREKEQNSSYDGQDVQKVFVPFSAIIRDFPDSPPRNPMAVDRLLVTPRRFEDHEACKGELRRALARLYHFDPRDEEAASIWDTLEEAKGFRRMAEGMKYFLGAVGLATLFIGGIGVMNVMLVAVRERTREIGIRKALGATRRSVLSQFFVETLIVVFLSGGLGMGFAFALCGLVNLMPMPPFFAGLLVSWQTGLLAFGLLGTTAVLAALYPARRAARVDPIEALRYEAGG
jgi:putative ABC transport system permease protein